MALRAGCLQTRHRRPRKSAYRLCSGKECDWKAGAQQCESIYAAHLLFATGHEENVLTFLAIVPAYRAVDRPRLYQRATYCQVTP